LASNRLFAETVAPDSKIIIFYFRILTIQNIKLENNLLISMFPKSLDSGEYQALR
jgi:hypothetical protein